MYFFLGFTAILGKLIHANAEVLVFYRMLFAAGFLYVFIRFIKKDSIKISIKMLLKLIGIGSLDGFSLVIFL